jgi:hypothetical protein
MDEPWKHDAGSKKSDIKDHMDVTHWNIQNRQIHSGKKVQLPRAGEMRRLVDDG